MRLAGSGRQGSSAAWKTGRGPPASSPHFRSTAPGPPKRDEDQRSDTQAGVPVHRPSKRTGRWTCTARQVSLSGACIPRGGRAGPETRQHPAQACGCPGLTAAFSSLKQPRARPWRELHRFKGDQCNQGSRREESAPSKPQISGKKEHDAGMGRGWRSRPGSPLNLTNTRLGGNLR